MNRILLVLICLVVACAPQGSPSASDGAAVIPTLAPPSPQGPEAVKCGDDCGAIHQTALKPAPDARTPMQIALAACARSDGSWACPAIKRPLMASSGNATQANCGPACTVGQWYFDNQNSTTCASDANSCTSSTCGGAGIGPCLTFAQIITRLGSQMPQYPFGQGAIFSGLSAQTAGQDVIFFEPRGSGGAVFTLDMRLAWAQAGAAFSAGALSGGFGYAAATPAVGSTMLTIAGMPGYVVAGTLLNNTSKSSYAFADSAGGGTVQQPLTVAALTTTTGIPSPVQENDWLAADNIQPYTLPLTNLKKWSPVGSDVSAGGQPTAGWVIGARIADTSGSGASAYQHVNNSAINVLSVCKIDVRLHVSIAGGRGAGVYVLGSAMNQLMFIGAGDPAIFGGGIEAGFNNYGTPSFNSTVSVHGTASVNAGAALIGALAGFAWSDGTWNVGGSSGGSGAVAGLMVTNNDIFFGSYSVNVMPGSTFVNGSGSTFLLKALLTSGTAKINTIATGYSFTAGTGVWGTGTAITPTAIDGAPGASLYGQGGSGGYITVAY